MMNSRSRSSTVNSRERPTADPDLPVLLTPTEAATLLRTTRKAIYALVARHQIPGVVRVGRRVLFRARDLLHWLGQESAPSPKE
jgi:excisionase family DNA binding protein